MRLLLLLGLGSLLGCISACALSSPALSPGSTGSIEPLEYTLATGTLVATVEGYPRDVQYFVNGVRIDSEEEIRWWKDAEIRLELKPGAYRLSATYVARGFAPDAKQFHIETKEPFQIRAGQETHVRAVILKDWRGVPETDTTYFEVWDPTKQPAANGSAAAATSTAATAVASGSEGAGEGAAAALEPAGSYPAGGVTVIHGTRDGEPEIEQVGQAAALPESEPITIRGHEVLAPESGSAVTSAPGSTGEPAGSPATSSAAPASETPPPAAPQQAEAGGASPATEVAPTTAPGAASTPAGEAPTTAAGATSTTTVTESAAKPSTESTTTVGLPAIEVPAQEELPPPSTTAPAVAAGASAGSGAHATVMVLLETEPEGAQVSVDDQAAGATPLRVRLDPTVDHVVQFSRDGCSNHVRFLSAAGWEKGRSPTLHVQLECP